jgi:hypothetical protein
MLVLLLAENINRQFNRKKSDFFEENKMNLLDKAATDLNSHLSKDRNMGYIELYLGATIYLGKTKK